MNPLHAGHSRLLRAAKERAGTVVLCMSGNFTQRGEPAVCDKFIRAAWAIRAGADLVLELPVPFVLSSAEKFCFYGVSVLQAFGADGLAFGSESGDLDALREAALRLDHPETTERLKKELAEGISYPKARGGDEVLKTPNNLLGVEYLRAIRKLGAKMEVFTLKREGEHDGSALSSGSSSSIRRALSEGNLEEAAGLVPAEVYRDLRAAAPWSEQVLFSLIRYVFRTCPAEELAGIHNMGEGLHHRFIRAAAEAGDLEDFYQKVKTKRYPLSRIRRAALCALLGIREKETGEALNRPPILKVLAVSERRKDLLTRPGLLINAADGRNCPQETIRADERAASVYGLLFPGKGPQPRDMVSPPFVSL